MAHDRIAFGGTLVSAGLLYATLVWFGVRRHVHWARATFGASAVVGLASFFLFLLYGYLDPLHGVLWLLFAALYVAGRRWPAHAPPEVPVPDLAIDRAWRQALVGQLLLVVLGIGLLGGGLTIGLLGSTRVFVPEDLEFLDTTAPVLAAANARLLPLIAHDRAGFGGALAAVGVAVLCTALWGVRRGARWVWWALAVAGPPAFAAGLVVHLVIGYEDPWHLAPVGLAAGLYAVGLRATYRFMCGRS